MTRSFLLLSVLVAAAAVERRVTSEPSSDTTLQLPVKHAVQVPHDAGACAPHGLRATR